MKQEEKDFLLQRYKENLGDLERYIEEFSVFLPLAVCTVNPIGIIVDVNQAIKDLTGYSETDIIGQEIEFLFEDKKLGSEIGINEASNELEFLAWPQSGGIFTTLYITPKKLLLILLKGIQVCSYWMDTDELKTIINDFIKKEIY